MPRSKTLSKPIVCVLSADDRYAMGLAVTLRSLLESKKDPRPLHAYVLDGGITPKNRARIEASCRGFDAKLEFPTFDATRVRALKTGGYLRTPTYFRLLIPELLPRSIPKALYLDADLLVLKDIGKLWDTPLGKRPLAAAPSMLCPYVVSFPGIPNYRSLGLAPDTRFLNGGVLLLNLDVWRKERLTHRIITYIEKNREFIQLCDNDGLVVELANRWLPLDYRWNVEHDSPPRDAAIVHFVDRVKPWHYECSHPAKDKFFEVLDRTPWKGWRPPFRKPPRQPAGPPR